MDPAPLPAVSASDRIRQLDRTCRLPVDCDYRAWIPYSKLGYRIFLWVPYGILRTVLVWVPYGILSTILLWVPYGMLSTVPFEIRIRIFYPDPLFRMARLHLEE